VPESPLAIEAVEEVTAELVEAFARLIPQLGSSPPPDDAALRAILAQPDTALLIARNEDGIIVGTLTLFTGLTPTGRKALIEDVVVDELARGRGAATSLMEYAFDVARSLGCPWIQLTSRPAREAANRLYQRLGFVPRETNLYRLTLQY
jgi:ribosomal protein S18 acetylase RimI-like enzyme